MIVSLLLFTITFFALLAEASPKGLSKRQSIADEIVNGSPGAMCYADNYNTLGNNWNHTYSFSEPQQLHISLTDDAKYARVQFATLGEIHNSVLQYWPKKETNGRRRSQSSKNRISIKGEVIT